MHWLRTQTQKGQDTPAGSRPELQGAFARQRETLYWIALMITGNTQLGEESVIDAVSLAESDNHGFRLWLAHWAHSATVRVAVNAVRSSINETAAAYADWTCSHPTHEPLSRSDHRSLRELNPYEVIQRLDIVARAVLVLYGCHRMSLAECARLLDVPHQSVVGAYCRGLQWYGDFAQSAHKAWHADCPHLHFVCHDPDGVPVWGSECPTAA